MRHLALLVLILCIHTAPAVDLINGLGFAQGAQAGASFGENRLNGLDVSAGQGVTIQADLTPVFNPPQPEGTTPEGVDITPVFPNGLRFGNSLRTRIWINMHGNITFTAPDPFGMTPTLITSAPPARIAPYWADVDTTTPQQSSATVTPGGASSGTNTMYWDLDTINGIVTITWDDVGYYPLRVDKRNAFQMRMIRVGDLGDFDLEFRYEAINWTASSFSGGTNGLGGTCARMGFTSGDGVSVYELPAAGIEAQALDLENTSNCGIPGLYYFQIRQPVPVITPPEGTWTNASPINFIVTYNVPVNGITGATATGGTIGAITATTPGLVFVVPVTPSGDGPVTLRLPAGASLALGSGIASAAATRTVNSDRTPPVVSLSPTTGSYFVPEIGFTLTTNEPLINFTRNTPQPSNGAVRLFSLSGINYPFTVMTAADGPLTVTIPAASYSDRAGNHPAANLVANLTVKTIGPAVTVVPTPAGPDNVSPISFAITFGASVTGFTAADLVVANGTVASFAGSGASYTVTVTPAADGLVTLTVPAGSGVDSDGLGNRVGGASALYDLTPPTVTITMPTGPIAGAQTAYLQFSEPVSGVTVSATGGTAGAATAQTGDPTRFAVTITPTATGTYTLNVTGASDVAGNALAATVSASVAADTTLSQLAITTTAGSRTATSPIPVTFTFTAAPTGFTAGDVQVANGAAGSLVAATATTFTMNITPAGSGTVTVSVPAGACTVGAASNGAASLSVIYDASGPVPTVTRVEPSNGLPGSVVRVELTFSEAVTGFAVGDITAVGGTVTGLTANASNTVFIVTVATDLRPSTYTTITLTAGTFADAVGNVNPAATFLIQGTIPGSGPGRDSGGCGGGMGLAFLLVGLGAATLRRRRG